MGSRFQNSDSSFFWEYLWKYKRSTALGVLVLVIVDVLEIIPPLILKEVVDILVQSRPLHLISLAAGAYFFVAIGQGICRYYWRKYLVRTSMLAGRDLRELFTRHILGLSASFFDHRKTGELMSHATNDTEAIRLVLGPGFIILIDAIFYFVTVPVAMLMLSPKLTALVFLPLLAVPIIVIVSERKINTWFGRVQASFSRLAALAQENLMGIRLIKAFANEDAQIRRFENEGDEYVSLNLKLARVQSALGPMLDLVLTLGVAVLLIGGGQQVISGALTLGTFVAFQRYIKKMIWPMSAIGYVITFYQRGIASSRRIKEVLKETTDIIESPSPKLPEGAVVTEGPWRTCGKLEVRNLWFRFPRLSKCILENISFVVEPGERLAIVGEIGSGKSVLLSLIPRLYPVSNQMIYIDGVDINEWPLQELRAQIGYVSQDAFLFGDTIAENVGFGLAPIKDGSEVLQRVLESTRAASIHDEIEELTSSYQTRLGERGINVSGGQRQRLTIARALAKHPSILILDDAFSSVDVRSEEKILRGLRHRARKNTEIVTAHRISTVAESDQILVLKEGQIVQRGNHTTLIEDRKGLYFRFYERQRLKEELEHYVERLEN